MKRYHALKASAGSGKTFALTVRYISLLLSGAKPNEILCLTFTNKAANEMKQRIVNTLFDLENKQIYLSALQESLHLSMEEILNLKSEIIDDFLNAQINILTIDKFVNTILREFSGFGGVSDDYKIESLNIDYFVYKFLNSLDEKEFDLFIEFIYKHGKSIDALVDIFRYLDDKNEYYAPKRVDNKKLELLKNEVLNLAFKIKQIFLENEKLSDSGKKSLDFCDFESLMEKGKTWLVKDTLSEYSYFKKYPSSEAEKLFVDLRVLLKEYIQIDGDLKLNFIFLLYDSFANFKQQYTNQKNAFEFSDVTNRVYNLLNTVIDKQFLYFRLDAKFNHLLIDEFQDTSLIQYKILKPLIEEVVSGESYEYKSLFFVGDTKQAIYRFRNGKKELFDNVCRQFSNIEVGFLDTNYRSSSSVITFVNDVFSNVDNYEYFPQKSNLSITGLVEVKNCEEDWLLGLKQEIEHLLFCGISLDKIAILTFTNDEIFEIYDYFKENAPHILISTEMTNLLINQKSVKAVINLIKYFYFEDEFYLANFNSILGRDLQEKIVIHKNFAFLEKLIFDMAIKFDLFDENMKYFIESLSAYKDIVDFVYEIDLSEVAINNVIASGVLAMTIFKAKGLEFHNVIVLDRFKSKSNFSQPILFDYDGVNLKQIYYKTKNRELFDELYFDALNREKQLQENDTLNILYVALTRAQHNMIVLKKEKNSIFISLDLQVSKIGELYIEPQITNQNEVQLVSIGDFNVKKQKIKSSSQISDSNIKGEYFGTITHFILQIIDRFDIASLDKAFMIAKSKYFNFLENSEFDIIYSRLEALVCDLVFLSLVEKSNTILKEQPMMFNGEHKIVDLYLDMGDFGVVVDYKTGSVRDEYFAQVATYKKALSTILNKPILGFILYIWDEPKFFEV